MLEVRLAWRNVWRNRRRTFLTSGATVFAVALVVFFVAMAAGLHEKMIEDSVRLRSGHVTLSARGYRESRTLDLFIPETPALRRLLEETPGVRAWAPRVVGFGLLSREETARGVSVVGVDPDREARVSTLSGRVREGRFVRPGAPREIVLGGRLADRLEARLGDELLLYSVAYTQEMAYELFRVVGIFHLPDQGLDRTLAVVSLAGAQEFFGYPGRWSEVAVLTEGADAVDGVVRHVAGALDALDGPPLEVVPWNEWMPELAQLVLLDDAGMYLLLVVLVVVVGFGILNTILMSILERRRELGVVLALGLRPAALFRLVALESLFLAGVGLVVGLAVGLAAVLYFQAHPVELQGPAAQAMELFGIEPVYVWKLKPGNPLGSTITILGVAILASLYPAWKASRTRPVEALRTL